MSLNVTKYMVIVETKNYPINSINPIIQRYSRIKKRMNASEIATCLAFNANVTLVKNNGMNVKLTKDNFKKELIKYNSELTTIEFNKSVRKEEKNNTAALEKIKKETTPSTVTSKEENVDNTITETEQPDPEDVDTFDSSSFYDEKKK